MVHCVNSTAKADDDRRCHGFAPAARERARGAVHQDRHRRFRRGRVHEGRPHARRVDGSTRQSASLWTTGSASRRSPRRCAYRACCRCSAGSGRRCRRSS